MFDLSSSLNLPNSKEKLNGELDEKEDANLESPSSSNSNSPKSQKSDDADDSDFESPRRDAAGMLQRILKIAKKKYAEKSFYDILDIDIKADKDEIENHYHEKLLELAENGSVLEVFFLMLLFFIV
jgi:hypothetical protein